MNSVAESGRVHFTPFDYVVNNKRSECYLLSRANDCCDSCVRKLERCNQILERNNRRLERLCQPLRPLRCFASKPRYSCGGGVPLQNASLQVAKTREELFRQMVEVNRKQESVIATCENLEQRIQRNTQMIETADRSGTVAAYVAGGIVTAISWAALVRNG